MMLKDSKGRIDLDIARNDGRKTRGLSPDKTEINSKL